jgi:hypothetical protein
MCGRVIQSSGPLRLAIVEGLNVSYSPMGNVPPRYHAIRGAGRKQPYAIAMKDGSPFGLAGLWENWRNPNTDEWERTLS